MNDPHVSPLRKILGWAVHFYTGCGLLLAAWIVSLLFQTERTPDTYRMCFLLMLVATFVDATDGTLARAVRIREAVPSFDGRRLDDLVDFLLYTCVPLLLIDRAELVPESFRWVLLVALCASAYGFCQSDIKTADGAFLGFPSYWNIVAFYLYVLPITGEPAVGMILILSLLTFVPSRYPYPTQPGRANWLMLVLVLPWAALMLVILLGGWNQELPTLLIRLSVLYPAFYLGVAWTTSVRRLF